MFQPLSNTHVVDPTRDDATRTGIATCLLRIPSVRDRIEKFSKERFRIRLRWTVLVTRMYAD